MLSSVVSVQTARGTVGFDLDQNALRHISAKLRSSNLLKHPLYGIHALSLIILVSLFFAFPVVPNPQVHFPPQ